MTAGTTRSVSARMTIDADHRLAAVPAVDQHATEDADGEDHELLRRDDIAGGAADQVGGEPDRGDAEQLLADGGQELTAPEQGDGTFLERCENEHERG